jgi:hypothetical protein
MIRICQRLATKSVFMDGLLHQQEIDEDGLAVA